MKYHGIIVKFRLTYNGLQTNSMRDRAHGGSLRFALGPICVGGYFNLDRLRFMIKKEQFVSVANHWWKFCE